MLLITLNKNWVSSDVNAVHSVDDVSTIASFENLLPQFIALFISYDSWAVIINASRNVCRADRRPIIPRGYRFCGVRQS